jgi:uncharacterized membrane protein YgdD (TMEM256/DUF423 family)
MHRSFVIAGAVLGGLAVALGAFGAHGLERVTSDAKILHGFRTGVEYQMYHSLALLAVAALVSHFPNKWMKWAANCFIIGILLFSGSLYLLTFLKTQGSSGGISIVGPLTPLGGVFFIAGWLFMLVSVLRTPS